MAKVNFRTNALLKNIIGKDLITDDNVAVLELVKNSFDAGSDTVKIVFKNLISNDDIFIEEFPTSKSSKLFIIDEGIGMSEFDISEKWLNIAYSEKKEKSEEFGRILAGNKGVGRFSCDRLGEYLTIYTKKVQDEFYNKLFIDWTVFEKEGEIDFNIQDIDYEIEKIESTDLFNLTGIEPFNKGTVLEISSLREEWIPSKIIDLRRQLERLINPNQAFKKGSFGIEIIAKDYLQHDSHENEFNRVNGIVENKIFKNLDFRTTSIQSIIDDDGEYITTVLQDRGNQIFTIRERNPYSQLSNIKITIFYLNSYSKAYFTKQTGVKSVDFGSIFLFINGFRIPPYGDVGDDWLGMEIRKGQGHSRYLGTREIVGRIEITDNKNKFKIISSRSGVVNNIPFNQLTKSSSPFGYYYKIFRRLERFVVEGIDWDKTVDKASKIEKDITHLKWSENKENFLQDPLQRSKNILQVIRNVIDVKKEDIVFLNINEDFVTQIIEEQAEKSQNELVNLIKIFNEKSSELDTKKLNNVLSRFDKNSNELKNFSKIISGFDNDALKNLDDIEKEIDFYKSQFLKIKEDYEEKAQEAKDLAQELELEKQKNTYLLTSKRTLSEDAKGLLHNVKQTSKKSKQNAESLYQAFIDNTVKKNNALKNLSTIIYNSDKALKISNLITRANFKTNADYQDVNIVKFIEQYLDLYNVMFEDNNISFSVDNKDVDEFWKRISILDISLIFDDLISNSIKAGAKNINVKLSLNEGNLKLLFSDNGKGLNPSFLNKPDIIFDLGITTTDGSGIGLNSVKNTLSKMQGKISFAGNGIDLEGAAFELIIPKTYN